MSLTLSENAPRALVWSRVATVHIILLCAIVASQIIFTPAHDPSADATWHFRLALDILHGRPIYWFGVDANRFFPDLIFTILGILASGEARFTTWLYFFYSIQFIAAYLALWALSTTLYEGAWDRLGFCVLTVSALLLLTILSPFWCGWLLEPGGHGTSLSACIALLALALWMNGAGRRRWIRALAFVVGAALLVASNRYLLVGFLAPLLIALSAGWVSRRYVGASRRSSLAGQRARGPLPFVIACTILGAIAGYVTWRFMETLSWYKLTGGASFPTFPTSHYAEWLGGRFKKEFAELSRIDGETAQIRIGLAILLATFPATGALAARLVRRGPWSCINENRLIFAVFTVASALAAMAFVLIMAVESGPYHYRYLTIPVAFAVVFLSSLLLGLRPRLGRGQGWVAATALVGVVAASGAMAARRQGTVDSNQSLQKGVAELERVLASRSSARPMRGFAEYWIAHDVTVRSRLVHLSSMHVEKAQFTLYNSNAHELCSQGFFFVLHDKLRDEPKRSAILAGLGEPNNRQSVNLGRYSEVEILYYDPALLRDRVVEPSKDEVRRLFPGFKCP